MPLFIGKNPTELEIGKVFVGKNQVDILDLGKGNEIFTVLQLTGYSGTLSNVNSFGSNDVGSITIQGTPGATGNIAVSNGASSIGSFTIPASGTFVYTAPSVSSNQGDARTPTWTLQATGDTLINEGLNTTLSVSQSAALAADLSITQVSHGSVSYSSNGGGWSCSVSAGGMPVVYNSAVNPGFTPSTGGGSQSYSVSYWCSCNNGCQGGNKTVSVGCSKAGYRGASGSSGSQFYSYRRYGDYNPPLPGSPQSFPQVTTCNTCTANPCYYFEPQN